MSELRTEHLGADIWLYHDAVPAGLCADIIKRYIETADRCPPTPPYDNRECETVKMSQRSDWADLDQQLQPLVGRVLIHHYSEYKQLEPFSDEGYEVCCYEPGEICREHCDGTTGYGVRTRLWALAIYLNDCEEGKVVFTRQGITISPKQGLVAVWPPHMTHPHKTLPAFCKRYMIVTWSTRQSD